MPSMLSGETPLRMTTDPDELLTTTRDPDELLTTTTDPDELLKTTTDPDKLPARCFQTACTLFRLPRVTKVVSDQGSQLTASDNSVKVNSLNWEQVELPSLSRSCRGVAEATKEELLRMAATTVSDGI